MERKLEICKEYGVNAIRCSHNQPSPEFLDLCDRMGFVVIDEAFDKWKSGYYAQYFDAWWQEDLKNMLVRDRNHPCVVLWSIGNELQEAWDGSDTGCRRAAMLQDFVHGFEPSRQVCLAAQNRHNEKFSGVTDVVGYNYLEARMLSDHKKFPERRFLVTEELPYYCGAEGNIRSYDTNNPWNIIAENDFIAGGFLWTGTDYIGEAGWPSHGWPAGLFDICMVEKPRAAFPSGDVERQADGAYRRARQCARHRPRARPLAMAEHGGDMEFSPCLRRFGHRSEHHDQLRACGSVPQRQRDGRTPDGGLPEPYDNVVPALPAWDACG